MVIQFPKDPYIHGLFITTKKKFRYLVKYKYLETKAKLLREIVSSQENNPQDFWKLVNKLKGVKTDNSNPVPISEWVTYFKSLHQTSLVTNHDEAFSDYVKNTLQLKTGTKCDVMDAPIIIDELLRGVSNLKMAKPQARMRL